MRLIQIILFFLPALCYAQQTAFFETEFYFEDAEGNKDTMVIGHDPGIDDCFVNPQLGEIEITSPWDSIFEVRAAHFCGWTTINDPTWLNKVIGGVELQNFQDILEEHECYLIQEWFYIAIRAKYKPVTIRWDQSVFETNYCKVRSTLSNHDLGQWFPNWSAPEAIEKSICLAEDSVFVTDLVDCCTSDDMDRTVILEGGAEGNVNGMFFQFQSVGTAGNHCSADLVVNTQEIIEAKDNLLYPNPTSALVYFKDGFTRRYRILDINGNFVQNGYGQEINMTNLVSGMYLVHYIDDGQSYMERIVKMGQ